MKFSILTITKDAETFVEKTLISVKDQTFFDYEHIVFDGGSKDGTLAIVKRFPRVKLLEGRDAGISDAMNQVAKEATGEFLMHLHADDYLADKEVLAKVATTLKQHPKIEWLYGQAHFVDEKDDLIHKGKLERYSRRRLLKYNFITHPATFIRRTLFEKVGGFDPALRYAMDYDLWLRLSKEAPAFLFPAHIATMREHQGSLSTREKAGVAEEAYQVRNRYIKSPYLRFRSYRTWQKRSKGL